MKSLKETNYEEFSVAISNILNDELFKHLIREDGQEDVAFALYKPSVGTNRFTALIHKIILPNEGDRNIHGNATINPDYIKKVCRIAATEKSGIVLLHSHPSMGWQGMSIDDICTEQKINGVAPELTDLPFVGLTMGLDGTWSARIWEYNNGWFERKMAAKIRVVGKRLHVHYNDTLVPKPSFKEIYKRTVTVWGEKNHASIARLKVGIVGLGSVGSMVAEALARMGIERVVLIDFDEVQEHNLDRLLGATIRDIGHSKAMIAQRQILKSSTATNPQIKVVLSGITEELGYKSALDCDVLFSCVDRPWPRHVMNHIAYNHLIPVIDGGIKVKFETETKEFLGADWQAVTVGPERVCLKCVGQYESADVSTEREGLLDDPTYLDGLPVDHTFKRNENIFPFSMNLASLEVLQFVEMVTGIGEVNGYYGTQRYSYNQGYIRLNDKRKCEDGCLFVEGIALGDSMFPPPTGFDHSADNARKRQDETI